MPAASHRPDRLPVTQVSQKIAPYAHPVEGRVEDTRMAEDYDYHFMVLAPGLQSAWFFQAARQFWQRFQPIVTDDLELLTYVPTNAKVAVTILARSDTAEYARQQVEGKRNGLFIDMIVQDDLPGMESILNERAESGVPFGE